MESTTNYVPPPPPKESSRQGLAGLVVVLAVLVPIFLAGVLASALAYAWVASRLPSVDELQTLANSFRSTRIYDRDGMLLNEAFDPDLGRRIPVPLDQISPELIQATIATEDANFHRHSGVDPFAIGRAVYYAMREQRIVSGASTIPQQLAKRLYLSPERTMRRKLKEVVLATEISRRYSKDEILELYLNEIYYGNMSYGIRAAADTYFGKSPAELSLAEAAVLAGLPQAPAFHDPYSRPDRAAERQAVVLGLMVENGDIDRAAAARALTEELVYRPPRYDFAAPHFTLFVREELERRFGPEALTSMGLEVTTTLDRQLQTTAEETVRDHVAALREQGREVGNGALVAIKPASGEIVAFVGSAAFNDASIDGQVNMALAPRQPGSTMKPLAYLAALEGRGQEVLTPGSILADIQTGFPDGANPPYVPRNYDREEHGLVTVRRALGNSYNIPAVQVAADIGVNEIVRTAERLGITTLTRPDYGLSLVLGAGEIPLIEMTTAFGVLANAGRTVIPQALLRITDGAGTVLCGPEEGAPPCADNGEPNVQRAQVVDPVDAFLMTALLSDPAARLPAFQGVSQHLSLSDGRPAAVKTGTTDDFADSLTIGYTPQLVTGVWVGNADRSPMNGVPGSIGAAPIWSRFMSTAHAELPVTAFAVPPGVAPFEVCEDTGALPSEACPATIVMYFATDHPPLGPEHDLWQRLRIIDGQLAPEGAPICLGEESDFKVYPPEHRSWAEVRGIAQPPSEVAALGAEDERIGITQPADGAAVSGAITVTGSADVAAFESWTLWYGEGSSPRSFYGPLLGPSSSPAQDQRLGTIDMADLSDGQYVLRLVVRDRCGDERDHRVSVRVANPTATATATVTPTSIATATLTVAPTLVLQPIVTVEPAKEPAPGPAPTLAERPTPPAIETIGPPPIAPPEPTAEGTSEP